VPFTLDAYKLGFLPGFREDCGYQETQYQNLSIPVGMLDNDFRNPDLERFVDRFFGSTNQRSGSSATSTKSTTSTPTSLLLVRSSELSRPSSSSFRSRGR